MQDVPPSRIITPDAAQQEWPPKGVNWYYSDESTAIACGDCRAILPHLPKVDLVLTDPPYGIDFDTDYRRFTSGFSIQRNNHAPVHGDTNPFDPTFLLAYGRKQIIWGANCFSSKLPLGSWLIWDKRFKNGEAFLADAEAAWMSTGYGIYIYAVTQQGCIRPEPIQHPTQKPEEVMKWCVQQSNTHGTILDPFMGSGTTLRAAKDLGRKCIGIEIELKYVDIAIKRLQQQVLPLDVQPIQKRERDVEPSMLTGMTPITDGE